MLNTISPEFILNGSKEIKRSFLSGIFGGDGGKINWAKRKEGVYNYQIGALCMSKTPEHIDSLKKMFQDMADDYGYKGELYLFSPNTIVNFCHITENVVRLLEHRFDDEMKIIREQLGLKKP